MSSFPGTEALLQATKSLTFDQASALDEAQWTLDNYELLERIDYIAKWFDYWEDWEPAFAEALDIAREQDWVCDDESEEILRNASHTICLAYQAMIYERYLTPEELEWATEPALSILG